MKYFGIWHKPKKDRQYYLQYLHIPFVVIVCLSFVIFSFYYNVTNIIFAKNKIDVFKEDLQQIALYFWTIDKELSEFLVTVDAIVTSYSKHENILDTKEQEIQYAWEYISNNSNYLKGLGFDNYTVVIDLMADMRKYKDEFFTLLGKDQPHNYLIILQNSNEKRPNGGFFGSFAFVQIYQARITDLRIVDAYYPDYIAPNTRLQAPSWTSSFLPERTISFVAANKFGFTDMDGSNIKLLYEKMFNETYNIDRLNEVMEPSLYQGLLHQYIKGVIFIQTDLLELLIPGFHQQIWERQFVNASIDLIRGEELSNKKEQYIREVNDYFRKNQTTIFRNFINKFAEVLSSNLVHVYTASMSPSFNGFLQKWGLTNVYEPSYIYSRDTNDSYNKIDNFVHKHIQIVSQDSYETVVDSSIDKITIADLDDGSYTMRITYTLDIPAYYKEFINTLSDTYNITLTSREETILGIKANTGIDTRQGLWRKSRSTIYFPDTIQINTIRSDDMITESFKSPFAHGLFYPMYIAEDETQKTISIDFTLER